jgi:hypothetical protein
MALSIESASHGSQIGTYNIEEVQLELDATELEEIFKLCGVIGRK